VDVAWRQINYGQGEGQVDVAGREWGIYQAEGGGLVLVLHSGELAAEQGLEFARRVADVVAGGTKVELLLQGTDAERAAAPDRPRD
jgi:hypothetical protein